VISDVGIMPYYHNYYNIPHSHELELHYSAIFHLWN